jgi:Tol biopolymer transport system component
MFNIKLNHTILVALLAIVASGFMAAGAAAANSGAVVFSMHTTTAEGEEGGLYAARNGRLNQLTENPADSQPDFSADGRTIAFARGGDIWAMRADGSGQHLLTADPKLDGRPLVAPNGRYVVFERRTAADAPRDLYTVRIGGGEAHALVSTPVDEREATFTPDGCMIAFARSLPVAGGGVEDDVFSIRPAGVRLRRLTRTAGIDEFAPRYFGPSENVVFSRGRSGDGHGAYADIYTMRNNGRKLQALIRGAGSAYVEDVTPNGRLLLFRRAQGLWVKPLAGGRRGHRRARKLTEVADQSTTNAVFSSDGRKVAAFIATDEFESLAAVDVARRRATTLAAGFTLSSGEVATSIGPVIAWQPVRR